MGGAILVSMLPKIGDRFRFIPNSFFCQDKGTGWLDNVPVVVEGTVCYVNAAHMFWEVEYFVHGKRMSECFKPGTFRDAETKESRGPRFQYKKKSNN